MQCYARNCNALYLNTILQCNVLKYISMLQYIVVQNIATQCEVADGASADFVELHCVASLPIVLNCIVLHCVASLLIVFYCILSHCVASLLIVWEKVGANGHWCSVEPVNAVECKCRTSQCKRMQVSNQSMRVWDKITIILKSRNAIFSCLPQ